MLWRSRMRGRRARRASYGPGGQRRQRRADVSATTSWPSRAASGDPLVADPETTSDVEVGEAGYIPAYSHDAGIIIAEPW